MIEPKLAYYIEEFNNAGKELQRIMKKMDRYKKYAKDECGVDIGHDRRIN